MSCPLERPFALDFNLSEVHLLGYFVHNKFMKIVKDQRVVLWWALSSKGEDFTTTESICYSNTRWQIALHQDRQPLPTPQIGIVIDDFSRKINATINKQRWVSNRQKQRNLSRSWYCSHRFNGSPRIKYWAVFKEIACRQAEATSSEKIDFIVKDDTGMTMAAFCHVTAFDGRPSI